MKYLLFLICFLSIAQAAFANEKIEWPITINIDPTHINYGTAEEPVALSCDYIADSYPAGRQVPYWVSIKTDTVWINPFKVSTVHFNFEGNEHLEQWNVSKRLRCKIQWQKTSLKPFSLVCNNVSPNSTIDIGLGLTSRQCVFTH